MAQAVKREDDKMTAQEAYILAKAYTNKSIEGAGSLKGAACQIKSIEAITGGHRITFEWEDNDGEVSTDTMDVMDGADGNDGVGISSITYKETDAHGNYVYTVTLTDTNTYDIICPKGAQGETGATGATGNGIASIEKTSTAGLVDTYTITYTNGQTTTFTVTNGESFTVDSAMSGSSTNPVQNKVITEALADKQDAEDNNLTTEAKTIVGAINEHEGDIGQLKSGLTNLDNEVKGDATTYPYADVITIPDAIPANLADCNVKIEPVQDLHGYDHPWVGGAGKNKLPMTVDSIKAANTDGTWSGNTYTYNDIVYKLVTDNDGNLVKITVNGTTTLRSFLIVGSMSGLIGQEVIMNGGASGGVASYTASGYCMFTGGIGVPQEYDIGSGATFTVSSYGGDVQINVNNTSVTNLDFYPMLRLSTETDATFAPYTNYCPITGHTEASVQRDGKNFAKNNMSTTTSSGVTWTKNSDGSISVSGTPTGNTSVNDAFIAKVSSEYGNVTFSGLNGVTNIVCEVLRLKDSNGVTIQSFLPGASDLTIDLSNYNDVDYITATYKRAANNVACSGTIKPQIEIGKTATAFVPYSGKTYTIALGDTIYGGTVNFDSGVMTVTMAQIASYDGETIGEPWMSDRDVYAAGTTPTTGAQVVYTLAEPLTVQLTPQQIQLLKGTNTITASTGQISVTVNGVSGAIGAVQTQANATDEALADLAADIAEQLPTAPTTDGSYVLTVTVADGTPTYSWESAT